MFFVLIKLRHMLERDYVNVFCIDEIILFVVIELPHMLEQDYLDVFCIDKTPAHVGTGISKCFFFLY